MLSSLHRNGHRVALLLLLAASRLMAELPRLSPPTIAVQVFDANGNAVSGASSVRTASILVDGCAADGAVNTPTLMLNGVSQAPTSVVTLASCAGDGKRSYFSVAFQLGLNTLTAGASDGSATATLTRQIRYDLLTVVMTPGPTQWDANGSALPIITGERTAIILVDGCSVDGTAATPTLTLNGDPRSPSTVTPLASCAGGKRGYFPVAFQLGMNTVTASISDGIRTATLSQQFRYETPPAVTMTLSPAPWSDESPARPIVVNARVATVLVDACDADGTVSAPTLMVNGDPRTPTSVNPLASCSGSGKRSYFSVAFQPGLNTLSAAASDGVATTTLARQVRYDLLTIAMTPGPTQWNVNGSALPIIVQDRTATILVDGCSVDGTVAAPALTLNGDPRSPTNVVPLASCGVSGTRGYFPAAFQLGLNTVTASVTDGIRSATLTQQFRYEPPPIVTITPADGATVASPQTIAVTWCARAAALATRAVSIDGVALPAGTFVTETRDGCQAAGTTTWTNVSLSVGTRTIIATATDANGNTRTVTSTLQVGTLASLSTPRIVPVPEIVPLPPNTILDCLRFEVTNLGSISAGYRVTLDGTSSFVAPSEGKQLLDASTHQPILPSDSFIVAPGQTRALCAWLKTGATAGVTAHAVVSAKFTGADGSSAISTANLSVPIIAPGYGVTIVPSAGSPRTEVVDRSQVHHTTTFTIVNSGTNAATFDYTSTCAGFAVCGAAPGSMTLAGGASGPVTVSYDVTTAVPGNDNVELRVAIRGESVVGLGAVALIAQQASGGTGATVSVSPTSQPVNAAANTDGSVTFTIRNSGAVASYVFTATCSGSVTNCIRAGGLSGTTGSIAAGAEVPVTVGFRSGGAGTSGAVSLAVERTDHSASATGTYTIAVAAAVGMTVNARDANAGPSRQRSVCVTIRAGDNGAYECGDLRLVHALPTTITMNKARTPTLIYSSAQARPVVLVAADVTVDASATPTSLLAVVRFARGDTTYRTFTWNAPSGAGGTRRIVVPVDAQALSLRTGAYRYTLEVRASVAGGATPLTATDTGTLVVVDRASTVAAAPFGRGWWVAGLEELKPVAEDASQLLWIGGDGSTRLYTRLAADTMVYEVIPSIDRPDRLVRIAGEGYRRPLPSGDTVVFDAFYRHTTTINASGHRTRFVWTGSRLDSLVLPVAAPNTVRRAYAFTYADNVLVRVTAPAGPNGPRNTTLSLTPTTLAISDPGLPAVTYAFDGYGRIVTRVNRLGDGTQYRYDGVTSTLDTVIVDLTRTSPNGRDSILTTFCPAEGAGISACAPALLDPNQIVTWYDGPRTDVADVTTFAVTRFGAPRRIVNAIGQTTQIDHGDFRFPLLPTLVVQPSGFRRAVGYNSRGLVAADTAFAPFGASQGNAITTYTWDARWDKVIGIRSPMQVLDTMGYDSHARLAWRQRGSALARRDTVRYDDVTGLVRASGRPGANPDSAVYDLLGNSEAWRSPAGYWTTIARDVIGRDSVTSVALDSADRARANGTYRRKVTTTRYDLQDRVSDVQTTGYTAVALNTQQVLTVSSVYDVEGHPIRIERSTSPDENLLGALVTQFGYDAAGRKVAERDGRSALDSLVYDAAGNVRRSRNRTGDWVDFTYDRLNRLESRSVPSNTFAVETFGTNGWAKFPMHPVNGLSGVTASGESATFTYDVTGGIKTANNGDAHVARGYYPNGALEYETQALRSYTGGNFENTKLTIGYAYDLDGRRTRLSRGPDNEVTYGYAAQTGELESVFVPRPNATFTFGFDASGRPVATHFPGAIIDTSVLDASDRLVRRNTFGPNYFRPVIIEGEQPTFIHSDSLTYDASERLLGKRTLTEVISYSYSGLGAIEESLTNRVSEGMRQERFTSDALANVKRSVNGAVIVDYQYEPGTGRMASQTTQSAGGGWAIKDTTVHDAAGNRVLYGRADDLQNQKALLTLTRSYYGADGQVVATNRRVTGFDISTESVGSLQDAGAWGARPDQLESLEEFRYDALGRRVLKRTRRTTCGAGCPSAIERYFWDGDNLLHESRYPGGEELPADSLERWTGLVFRVDSLRLQDNQPFTYDTTYFAHYGSVTYTHAGGMDRPLMVERHDYGQNKRFFGEVPVVLHYDHRGVVDEGTVLNGQSTQQYGITVDWPGKDIQVYGLRRFRNPEPSWFGNLADGMRDASGLQYRRNRYYDPQTGRFTQEDPIGLAGGMNLYGFAAGDPVNFTDPFGLCPMCVGAVLGIAEGYGVSLLLGQEYSWKQAAIDAALGATGAGLASKIKTLAKVATGSKVIDRVIGHHPEYLQVADAIGAKAFSVPNLVYKLAGGPLNRRFLDQGIKEGAEFVLATAKAEIRKLSALEGEVDYLLAHGYRWAANNMSLIPK